MSRLRILLPHQETARLNDLHLSAGSPKELPVSTPVQILAANALRGTLSHAARQGRHLATVGSELANVCPQMLSTHPVARL